MSAIEDISKKISDQYATEREVAIALHDYVRDNVKFGFNRYFDLSNPLQTMDLKFGHCIPKGRLMTAFFRTVNIESFLHFVVLPKQILKGAVTNAAYFLVPNEVSHCYTEVKIDGKWQRIDSYILDRQLFEAAQAKLSKVGSKTGYGTHRQATNEWNGYGDSFSQYNEQLELEDHGRVDDIESYYNSNKYRQKFLGIKLNFIYQLIGKKLESRSKEHLSKLRKQN